jgi:hypothetical protein
MPLLPKAKQPRKDAKYSADEIAVMNKYKEEYREQTSREMRAHVLKTKILVDLFNHWLDKGKIPDSTEEETQWVKVQNKFILPDNFFLIQTLGSRSMG